MRKHASYCAAFLRPQVFLAFLLCWGGILLAVIALANSELVGTEKKVAGTSSAANVDARIPFPRDLTTSVVGLRGSGLEHQGIPL